MTFRDATGCDEVGCENLACVVTHVDGNPVFRCHVCHDIAADADDARSVGTAPGATS